MAARTCLLCGKALSRFAATGEDFCSREHRNQYRLRQGMERLAEANQVASVMRRREVPRQIPTEQLRAGGDSSRRGYVEPLRSELPPLRVPRLAPAAAALPGSGGFLRPLTDGGAAPMLMPGQAVTISAARSAPTVPPALHAHVAPAPVVRPQPAAAQVAQHRRVASAPTRKPAPRGMRKGALPAPKAHFAPPRNIAVPAKGRELRVSMSAGFRLPEWKMRAAAIAPPAIAGMRWPALRAIGATRVVAALARTCAIESTAPEMRVPGAPAAVFEGNFRWPGAMLLSIHFIDGGTGQRSAFVPFGSEERR